MYLRTEPSSICCHRWWSYITSNGKIQEILALLALLALIALAGGGAASRHVNSFKSTSSSAPQRIYYVKGLGRGGLLADIPQYIIIVTRFNTFTLSF